MFRLNHNRSMGRARGTKSTRGSWPPELRDLQRRGGMAPDWHETWHQSSQGLSDLHVVGHDISLDTSEAELRTLWQKISWPIPVSKEIEEEWIADCRIRKTNHLAPHHPVTFIVVPESVSTSSALENLSKWGKQNPEALEKIIERDILPGIKGEAPYSIGSSNPSIYKDFLIDILHKHHPDCLYTLDRLHYNQIDSTTAENHYLFAWNFLAAINRGLPPQEAEEHAVQMSVGRLFWQEAMRGTLREKLQRAYPDVAALLPETPRSDWEIWKKLDKAFRQPSAWKGFVLEEKEFDDTLRDIIQEVF